MTSENSIGSDDEAAGISIAEVLAVLRKRLWMIVAIVIAVPVIVGILVSREPKVYRATATLVIDASVPQYMGQHFKDVVEVESAWWSAQETLQTELRILQSHTQAVAVAKA